MSYLGDIRLGETLDFKFCTTAAATGAPTTLAGTPVISAYVGNSVTQITAGITLTVDFDAVTGLHNVRVVATSGNGYATASNYQLVITTGTVGGTSAVGYVIGEFSIEARSAVMPTTAARTLDVSATGEAGLDWANVGGATTAVSLTNTTVATVTTTTTATNVTTVNGLAAGVVTAAAIATGAIDADAISADFGTEVAAAVWTDTLTTYTAGMAGKRLKGITAIPVIEGTINDAAATTTSFITTLTGYGANFFVDTLCLIEYAADKWQANVVTTYNTATGAMTFVEAFYAAPTNGLNIALSMTHIHPISQIQAGLALEATAQSILTDTAEIGVAGAGLTAINLPDQTMNITGNLSGSVGSVTGAIGSVTGLTASDVGAIKAKTDSLTFTKALELDANIQSVNGVTVNGDGAGTPMGV